MYILDCNDAVQMCYNLQPFIKILRIIIKIIQYSVPLLLLTLGTFDMVKASIRAADEKVATDARKNFIRRVLYGVAIFLVPFFVRLILNFVNNNMLGGGDQYTSSISWISCWYGEVDTANCNDIYKPDEVEDTETETIEQGQDTENQQGSTDLICYVYTTADCSHKSNTTYDSGKAMCKFQKNMNELTEQQQNYFFSNFDGRSDEYNISNYCSTLDVGEPDSVSMDSNRSSFSCYYKATTKANVSSTKPSKTIDGSYTEYRCSPNYSLCENAYNAGACSLSAMKRTGKQ